MFRVIKHLAQYLFENFQFFLVNPLNGVLQMCIRDREMLKQYLADSGTDN